MAKSPQTMAIEISTLFNKTRFKPSSAASYLVFFFYMPLGIVLFLLRILLSFQFVIVLAILPKEWFIRRIILRVFLFCMGIFVSCSGTQHQKKEAKVLISNHISLLDVLSIDSICSSKLSTKYKDINSTLNWLFSMSKSANDDTSLPTLIFPEEGTTNGNVALMKFSSKELKNNESVPLQPMVLTAYRSWFTPVHLNCLESTLMEDLLWCLYTPFTMYTICFLPVREIPNKEGLDDFAKSLQKDMAYVLDKKVTNFTAADKNEYIKRLKDEEKRREQQRLSNMNPFPEQSYRAPPTTVSSTTSQTKAQLEALKMIEQIKNVLPQVPVKIIKNELESTKNVDLTIAHLLDGSIQYTPLSDEDQQKENKDIELKRKSIIQKANDAAKKAASATTPTSWKDRQLSFQEKKKIMIENARVKYLELHPEYA